VKPVVPRLLALMLGSRAPISLPLALFGAAAFTILAGASFNIQDQKAETVLLALLAGVLAFGAGVAWQYWKYAAGAGVIAILIQVLAHHFQLGDRSLHINLAGLAALGLGGMLFTIGYQKVTADIHGRVRDLENLNARLEEQHRIFLAATEDPAMQSGTVAELARNTARQTSSTICCYFLAGPDGTSFVPQEGVGLEALRPQAVDRRRRASDPLVEAVESNTEFVTTDVQQLAALFSYMPHDLNLETALVVPIRVGDAIGGFVLIANKPGGYSLDDRRLATTLAMRAGAHLATTHAVALSKQETQRYALLNDLVKSASGLSFEEVLALVLDKGRTLVRYDHARVALFGAGDTYTMTDGSAVPVPIGSSALATVSQGQTVIRKAVTPADGLFSGLEPPEGNPVAEALVPIRGKQGVLGAICLGRRQANSFNQSEIPTLDELGTMAGIAVENSHMLEKATGQASKLDTAINALGEMAHSLTSVTEGAAVLERKTLESSARLYGVSYAMLTRAVADGKHRISDAIGFGEVAGGEIQNGQGVVGAVMLSGQPVLITDLSSSWDVQDPNLGNNQIRGALSVPMFEGKKLWGTLSVFDTNARAWTDDDMRVLTTLANESVVAVKNAELYDNSKRMIWELSNLHEGLKAVTSTLELDDVLEIVLGWAGKAAEAQIGCIALLDDETHALTLSGAYGTDRVTAQRLALEMGADICDEVLHERKPVMEAMDDAQSGSGALNPRAVLCVPILLREQPTGVLFLAKYQAGQVFTEDHLRLVTALGAQAAISIDNAKLFKSREEVTIAALKALAKAVDARDPYTAGHSDRVTRYSLVIAKQMDYAPDDAEAWRRLEQGGLLHDIGKIGVPDAVLSKPGKLTTEEFDLMKKHPVIGYEILENLKMLTDELVIVRSHHERADAKGYPDRKKVDELPIYAWIVSAADAMDAMTSDRPYRKGMSMEVALSEIAKGAGTHFHPEVAQAVLAAAKSGALSVAAQESMFKDAPVVGAFENPLSTPTATPTLPPVARKA
jgi:HD-GYP domain-containing protein (c-di-GMP phosphodiesterase class II)